MVFRQANLVTLSIDASYLVSWRTGRKGGARRRRGGGRCCCWLTVGKPLTEHTRTAEGPSHARAEVTDLATAFQAGRTQLRLPSTYNRHNNRPHGTSGGEGVRRVGKRIPQRPHRQPGCLPHEGQGSVGVGEFSGSPDLYVHDQPMREATARDAVLAVAPAKGQKDGWRMKVDRRTRIV